MTAQPRPLRRRRASVYVTTEVEINPADLEDAGWVLAEDATPDLENRLLLIVRAWHDDAHAEAWPWCTQQPCRDLRETL